MSDIKKTLDALDALNEMTSGCVASVAMPLGATQKRGNPSIYPTTSQVKEEEVEETKSDDSPAEFGLWKNSVLIGKEQKAQRKSKKKVAESIGPDKNDPWEKGWFAGHHPNREDSYNPYERGSAEYKRWQDGYDEAQAQPDHYNESVQQGVAEGKTGPGLWANIHAKRERIKGGSGERMRKPGSKGAPTAANFKAAKSEGISEGRSGEAVANAITRRIINSRSDLLAKFGVERVIDAIEQVSEWVGDTDEIGTSDVSGWVSQVDRMLRTSAGEGISESSESYTYAVGDRADYQSNNKNYPPFPVIITAIDGDYIEFKSANGKPIPGTRETEWSADPGWRVLTPSRSYDPNSLGRATSRESIEEEYNEEYDDEAGMAQSNLHTIARATQDLIDSIDDKENLPEWVQEKIAKAEAMMTTARDYLQGQEDQGIDPVQEENELDRPNIQDALERMAKRHRNEQWSDEQIKALAKKLAAADRERQRLVSRRK
jgi:hypothetical protein